MAKKKNFSKKHKFKHSEPAAGQAPQANTMAAPAAATGTPVNRPVRADTSGQAVRDFGYVKSDLRRIGILAGALVVLEVGLYYVLVHTPIGASVYSLVKV